MSKTYTVADMIIVAVAACAVGIVGTTGYLWRDLNTPDFELGKQAGYAMGLEDGKEQMIKVHDDAFAAGKASMLKR